MLRLLVQFVSHASPPLAYSQGPCYHADVSGDPEPDVGENKVGKEVRGCEKGGIAANGSYVRAPGLGG